MHDLVASVRSFNRFYTQLVGALDTRSLGTDITLAEARLLFEIAQDPGAIAADLQSSLGMDAGFVSRVIARFEARGWVVRERGEEDARQRPVSLTAEGRAVFEVIDARQRAEVAKTLRSLGPVARTDLLAALGSVRALLDPGSRSGFSIRTFRAGDMGSIAARQSILYAESHRWGRELEIIEGEVTTAFLRDFKPGREQCWVAEVDDAMAGSVMITDEGDGSARLRLLYVEPFARGRGIGDALVGRCVGFARDAGYRALALWTHTILHSARRIYAAQGFHIVETAMHEAFGMPVQGETWQLDLL